MPLQRDPSLIPLSHDHHHGLVRVFEIRRTLREGRDLAAEIETTRRFWQSDLLPHFRAEEDIVLPAIEKNAGSAETSRVRAEHVELAASLETLGENGARALTAFADLLERHIRFEERQLFPLYQERVPAAERAAVESGVRTVLGRPDDVARVCDLPPRR